MAIKYFRSDYSQSPSEPCWNAVCIPLTKGKHALIDIKDYESVSSQLWSFSSGYAIRTHPSKALHRIIMDEPESLTVDHINMNKLDNRRENLRLATHAENNRNCTNKKAGKRYKCTYQECGKWRVRVSYHNKNICWGGFSSEEEAARSYNVITRILYGEFFRPNIIDPGHFLV